MQLKIKNLDYVNETARASHRGGPDFVIIGGQKTGTTALFSYMITSPRVTWPGFQTKDKRKFKEAHFFDHCFGVSTLNTHYFEKPSPDSGYWCDVQLYRDLFQSCGKKSCGDASPSYMMYPEMPLLAHTLLPVHTKLIIMLREPLSRAISGFFQTLDHGIVRTFEDAVQAELDIMIQCETDVLDIEERYSECIWPRVTEYSLSNTLTVPAGWWSAGWEARATPKMCTSNAISHGSILLRGLYFFQLRDWIAAFGADRLMVLLSDSFWKAPIETTAKVIDFVSQHQTSAYVAATKRQSLRAAKTLEKAASNATLRNSATPTDFRLSSKLETKLRKLYAPYNELLYGLLEKHSIAYDRFGDI